MPIRVTIELIPNGHESFKKKIATINITNDGTGTHTHGNYLVKAEGEITGGWDLFFDKRIENITRKDYLDTVIECLQHIHT